VKRSNDVPMSAMWTQKPGVNNEQYGYNADIRESASVAHIYGQNLVAAESLTASSGAWAWSPATLKPTADKELAMGLNRFVIHTSVHQPLLDKKPGFALGPFGQWFNRNETWAEEAKPWLTYLARSSYLLQQGHFDADIVYFYGEDTNLTALFGKKSPEIPVGYNFDYINADALVHLLRVDDGVLSTPSGMRYRVLALDPHSQHMSLPVLRKIRDLVDAGAIVSGPKPVDTPSLSDDVNEFHRVADQLWGAGAGNAVGKGRVYGDQNLSAVLEALHTAPDFEYTKPEADTNLLFVHRRLADGDLYYIDNRNDRSETLDATFRVAGKEAELWRADTGVVEPASFHIAGDRTSVPLHLDPWGTVFVVFRKPANSSSRSLPKFADSTIATVEGPWELRFEPNLGAPAKLTVDKLSSWSENSDDGVKYFSGTGTYSKLISAPQDWFRPGSHLSIDLGEVKNLAEVRVNGTSFGVVWKPPYRIDVTGVLKPGTNDLEISVTNGWVNRIIGDRQPNATKTYTFTSPKFYKADSKLVPSGLLGPVSIIRSTREPSK
jgi:alpha-L-rhamnosidase